MNYQEPQRASYIAVPLYKAANMAKEQINSIEAKKESARNRIQSTFDEAVAELRAVTTPLIIQIVALLLFKNPKKEAYTALKARVDGALAELDTAASYDIKTCKQIIQLHESGELAENEVIYMTLADLRSITP